MFNGRDRQHRVTTYAANNDRNKVKTVQLYMTFYTEKLVSMIDGDH